MLPDGYFCTSDGRVYRRDADGVLHSKRVFLNNRGYQRVRIGRPHKWYLVHHLVMHYHGTPKPEIAGIAPERIEIGHRDGNGRGEHANNCIANLYWCTKSQNLKDRHKHKRVHENEHGNKHHTCYWCRQRAA